MSGGQSSELETVHGLVSARLRREPDATALIYRGARISCGWLERRANQIAHWLLARGDCSPRVGICLERSPEMIAALLGVLKAGGAYVPLDPSHPAARRAFVERDAELACVLSSSQQAASLSESSAELVVLDGHDEIAQQPSGAPGLVVDGAQLFYVLHTSGSTGRPKGVCASHAAIVNRLRWGLEAFPYRSDEVACAKTNLGFVDSVAEIFAPLAFGVPLVVIPELAKADGITAMLQTLAEQRVTRIVLVPSLLQALVSSLAKLGDELPHLRYWFVGGEAISVALVRAFKRSAPRAKLINIYGATELCSDATYYDFDELPEGVFNAPIGRPIRGTRVYVLDDAGRQVQEGEIYVAGACLAVGYLGRPELTAEVFSDDPFVPGERMYRTGDLGRWIAGGNLEYLGRIDQQVKIRGHRVELGEVETALSGHPGVGECAVLAHGDGLVAFFTASAPLAAGEIQRRLSQTLPGAMVPGRFIQLDRLPLNPNDKVDRAELARLAVPASAAALGPLGPLQERIAALWSEALGCRRIGREQDFLELGGTSLSAIRTVVALRQSLGVELQIDDVLRHRTVAALAAHIETLELGVVDGSCTPSVSDPPSARVALSYYQIPFWIFHALTGEVSMISEVFGFSEPIRSEALRAAYSATVAELAPLWTKQSRWRPTQEFIEPGSACLQVVDYRRSRQALTVLIRREVGVTRALLASLADPPHIRGRLLLLADSSARLVVSMPHVLADMSSVEQFRRGLETHYLGPTASGPSRAVVGLHDLVAWERGPGHARAIARDRAYWRRHIPGCATNAVPSELRSGPGARSGSESLFHLSLSPASEARLRGYAAQRGLGWPSVLISGFYRGLCQAFARDQMTVLVAIDKRDRPGMLGSFGNLASLLPLRVADARRDDLDGLIDEISRQLLESYRHGDWLMRHPTFFNDFWTQVPGPLRRALRSLSAMLARRWPDAELPESLLAELVFAICPSPVSLLGERARALVGRSRGAREILVMVNVLPEVYAAAQPPGCGAIASQRRIRDVQPASDFELGADPFFERVLTCQMSRDPGGAVVLDFFGGGLERRALELIGESTRRSLAAAAVGASAP